MNTKIAAITTLALGATALGGMFLFSGGAEEGEPSAERLPERAMVSTESYFESQLPRDEEPERPRRDEINTQGRSGGNNQPSRGGFGAMLDRMNDFDADGDGILSEEERNAMRQAMRDEWMARMDLDGDGELSREERNAARQAMFENSDRGQEMMRRFDADGNGVLDEGEQAAMEAYQQEQRDQRRQQELARYDSDGDGELSRQERQVQREEQRQNWGQMMEDARVEFDRDGDGELNIEESQEAYAVYMQRREIDRFVAKYDSDGNGTMDTADYSAFLTAYETGDLHADVNSDGVVNSQDLSAYADMVTRSRNRP